MKSSVQLSRCDPTLSGRNYQFNAPIYSKELQILVNMYVQKLERKGVDSPLNDVIELMAWFLELERGELQVKIAEKLTIKDVFSITGVDNSYARAISQMDFLIDQRAKRIPLQHITGVAHFYGLELQVGKGVFIPRPETELLVEISLKRILLNFDSKSTNLRVLDLCSGSGAIAIALATEVAGAEIVAVEKSTVAVDYLERNVQKLQHRFMTGTSVRVVQADATKSLGKSLGKEQDKFQIIVCNPPYIPRSQVDSLPAEVRKDPPVALFGDSVHSSDGFAIPADIIKYSVPLVADGGVMIIEHAEHQSDVAQDAFKSSAVTAGRKLCSTEHLNDLTGCPRFTLAHF